MITKQEFIEKLKKEKREQKERKLVDFFLSKEASEITINYQLEQNYGQTNISKSNNY